QVRDTDRNRLADYLRWPAGEIAEVRHGVLHVHELRVCDWLAVVERLDLRDLDGVLLEQVGDPVDSRRALRRGHLRGPRPFLERLARRLHGPIDVLRSGSCNLRDLLAAR